MFEKFSNIKFHENPSGASQVFACDGIDRQTWRTFVIDNCHCTNFIDILQYDLSFPCMAVHIHLTRDLLDTNAWMNQTGLGYKPPVRRSRSVDPSVGFCGSSLDLQSDLCHTLDFCCDRTVWRWSVVLAQKWWWMKVALWHRVFDFYGITIWYL